MGGTSGFAALAVLRGGTPSVMSWLQARSSRLMLCLMEALRGSRAHGMGTEDLSGEGSEALSEMGGTEALSGEGSKARGRARASTSIEVSTCWERREVLKISQVSLPACMASTNPLSTPVASYSTQVCMAMRPRSPYLRPTGAPPHSFVTSFLVLAVSLGGLTGAHKSTKHHGGHAAVTQAVIEGR